ncbi:GCN5-related N-acetyltransferase [Methanoregula boonei 6A8]|jgi:predicted transcriptional regulator/N-acetylglutamate synthase-like GNAT family acetyltransferase|uniref:GCN5-related N-acetyltransferase n=1 Tax=Methanoregula boonei (strain DSM 21154 / JCM 14090 / 6A8) TaxID=456442 RepID=A7IAQ3_METB6|nr:GNAT family N-acetyltransferase [Methanoregula boonei]ABS56814.1 GCN5-related N-acetyltransferase [Methanoregula boonei 6A8]
MSEYRLDRILQDDEIRQLNDLLSPKFSADYPNFEIWLKSVQTEMSNGKRRFAIGIWKEKLIATSIIKLTASGVAELKSFFVDPDFIHQRYSNDLYSEVENQCRKSGTTRIISYLYIDNKEMIEFLISKGFLISGKDDLYGNGRESYILSKALMPEYFGDPFDWENLGGWYLSIVLKAAKIEDHPVVSDRAFDRHMKIDFNNCSLDALVEIKDEKVDFDPIMVLHQCCSTSKYHFPIFVARSFSKRAEKYARENGVLIFSSKDIAKILGNLPPVFCDGPIKGMVVSIKPEYLKRLLQKKRPLYYVKGGPIGKKLQKGQTLVFYSLDPEKAVTALGEIQSVHIDTPQKIWNRFGKHLAFSEQEYFRFASIKQNIVAIELSKITPIAPIKESELDAIIPKKDRSGSYLSDKTLKKILKYANLQHSI